MTRPVDDRVRTAVRDLASEAGTPHGLAARALAQGRRRLRVRRTVLSTAAAVLVTVAAAVPYALSRHDTPPVVTTPLLPSVAASELGTPTWSTTSTYQLPGGAHLAGIGAYRDRHTTVRQFVVNPDSSGYRTLYKNVVESNPSPTGRYVLTALQGDEKLALLDVRTGHYRRLDIDVATAAVWSSDGSRLLMTRESGFSILDPATGTLVEHEVEHGETTCAGYCLYTWLPGETQVALPQSETANSEPSRVTGLAIFDAATGELLRNDPIKAAPIGRGSWSADGRFVLATTAEGSALVSVVDVATGTVVAAFPAETAVFLRDGTILASTGDRILHYSTDHRVTETLTLPKALSGRDLTFAE
ncbi:hypothetical protein [Actinoplanes sp. NPDC051851]|uniref:hypothetical protein n=1 Tax=Actinoplanes sp. NPDC051851 TaxID=3154753 RepID=UPI00341D6E6D